MKLHPPFEFPEVADLHSDDAKWFVRQLFPNNRLAHHPVCRCYDGHLLRIGKLHLCLGCTSLGLGILLSLVTCGYLYHAGLLPHINGNAYGVFFGGILMFIPTIIQPFYQVKLFKIFSRFLLGCSIFATLSVVFIAIPWSGAGLALKGIGIAIFLSTINLTVRYRKHFTPPVICSCKHPFCESNKANLNQILNALKHRVGVDSELYRYAKDLIENPAENFVTLQ